MAQTDFNPSNPPEPSARYKIIVSASPNYGYTSGSGWYNTGEQAWVSSSSYSPDYTFKYWTKNGAKYTESNSFYYTVETENVSFVAVYAYEPQSPSEPDGIASYRLYLKSNLSGSCSFNRTSGEKVKTGSSVYVSAYANSGYKFKGWYVGDTKQSDSRDLYYQMPEKDVTLIAHFEYDPENPDDPQSVADQPIIPKIKAKNYTREYGEANPVFGYYKNTDMAGTPTFSCEATRTSPVGTYPIVVSRGSVEGEDVILVNGTLTITKAPLVIQGGNYSKRQGEENPAFVLTFNGLKNDETEAVLTTPPTVTCSAEKLSPVGEYDVKVSGGAADNYEITCIDGKLTIAEADAIIITANNLTRVYGEANPELTYAVNGKGLSGTPELSCEATATSPVGTYDILISKGTISNSAVTYVKGTLTITKAPLTISANHYTKKQGEDNPQFTLTYDGFKNNDTEASFTTQPTVSCSATKDSPVGDYDVTVSGAISGNYNISYVNGSLTIEAVPTPEPKPTPEPTPESESKTFVEDVDSSASKEVPITFTITTSSSSDTPTVAISDDEGVSGKFEIPETVTHNGVEYKVTEIGAGAFQNNTALTDITIPASIISIGESAFAGCSNLKSITIYNPTPINLSAVGARGFTRTDGSSVFDGVNKNTCILYVHEGSVDAYRAAPVWKEFKNILPIKTSTGINGIEQTDGEPFDVFTLSGQKVKSKATSLDGLPRGIYIVKGKKVIK